MGWLDDFAEGFADGFVPVYTNRMARKEENAREERRIKQAKWDEDQEAKAAHNKLVAKSKALAESLGYDPGMVLDLMSVYEDPNYVTELLAKATASGAIVPVKGTEQPRPNDAFQGPMPFVKANATNTNFSADKKQTAKILYSSFVDQGLSDAQARALTAEVYREGVFNPKWMFGTHTDAKNNDTNIGILSWQGPRRTNLLNFLDGRGLLDASGNIIPGEAALKAQAEFLVYEMKNDPLYERTRSEFLANPDVDYATAHDVLGNDFIRWAIKDSEYRGDGFNRINEGYEILGESPVKDPTDNQMATLLGVNRAEDERKAKADWDTYLRSVGEYDEYYSDGPVMPQATSRIDFAKLAQGKGADLNAIIGKSPEEIQQWLLANGKDVREEQIPIISTISEIAERERLSKPYTVDDLAGMTTEKLQSLSALTTDPVLQENIKTALSARPDKGGAEVLDPEKLATAEFISSSEYTSLPPGSARIDALAEFQRKWKAGSSEQATPNLASVKTYADWEALNTDIRAKGTKLDPTFAEEFYVRGETLKQRELTAEAGEFIKTVKDPNTARAALAQARATGASPETITALEGLLTEMETANFQPPANLQEASARYQLATSESEKAALRRYIGIFENSLGMSNSIEVKLYPKGMTPEDIVEAGGVKTALVQTRVNADGVMEYFDTATGNPVDLTEFTINTISEDEQKARGQLAAQLQTPVSEYNKKVSDALAFIDTTYDLASVLEKNPSAATTVARIASNIVSMGREATTAANILSGEFKNNPNAEYTPEQLNGILIQNGFLRKGETLEGLANAYSVEDLFSPEFNNLAEAARVFEAKMVIAAFRAGGLEGQTGVGFSDKDFQRMMTFMNNAKTPKQFHATVSAYLAQGIRTVEVAEAQMKSRPEVQAHLSTYQRNPIVITPLAELVKTNPVYQNALKYFLSPYPDKYTAAPTATETPATPKVTGTVVTEAMVAQNPALTPLLGKTVKAVPDGKGGFTLQEVK
jgi:hypothetical protein